MKCEDCGGDTGVEDSRSSADKGIEFEDRRMVPDYVREHLDPFSFRLRRRKCLSCGKTFKTVELRYDDLMAMRKKQ